MQYMVTALVPAFSHCFSSAEEESVKKLRQRALNFVNLFESPVNRLVLCLGWIGGVAGAPEKGSALLLLLSMRKTRTATGGKHSRATKSRSLSFMRPPRASADGHSTSAVPRGHFTLLVSRDVGVSTDDELLSTFYDLILLGAY